jgi:hypothetical protein
MTKFYQGIATDLIPTKGTDENVCAVSPHVGSLRCTHVVPAPTFREWRCDKPVDHSGKHIAYAHTMLGIDTSSFAIE